MYHLFISSEKNNYHPHLLRRSALLVYIVAILLCNLVLTKFSIVNVKAAINPTELIEKHNSQREIYGVPKLELNQDLSYSATLKAQAMLSSDCWSHYCPNGKSPWDFFEEAGYTYQYAGENLAEGFKNTDSVITAWLNSPSHKENLLNKNFTEVGFGIINGTFQGKENNLIVVVHFGSRFENNTDNIVSATDSQNTAGVSTQEIQNTDSFIQITSPQDGTVLNSTALEISGIINPSDSNVNIVINDESSGKVNATGENYTFRTQEIPDGNYTIRTELLDQAGQAISNSQNVTVLVDGNAPSLTSDAIKTKYDPETNTYKFTVSASTDTVKAFLNQMPLTQTPNGWVIELKDTYINQNVIIIVELSDSFNNVSKTELSTAGILNQSAIYEKNYEDSNQETKSIQTQIDASQLRVYLAIAFVIYLIILMLIDFAVLIKTDMLKRVTRRTHIHIATLVILLLILNVGALTGSILTGLQQ